MTYQVPKTMTTSIRTVCTCNKYLSFEYKEISPDYVAYLEQTNNALTKALEALERVSGQSMMENDPCRAKARAALGYKND